MVCNAPSLTTAKVELTLLKNYKDINSTVQNTQYINNLLHTMCELIIICITIIVISIKT